MRARGGKVAVVTHVNWGDDLKPDYVVVGPLNETLPKVLAMDERSSWFNDSSIRTFYPGMTVIRTAMTRSISYADPMNTVPRHSRAFAVKCDPFVSLHSRNSAH